MPVPDYSDPTPAYKQIAGDIRDHIRSGEHAPGSRLPSNRALSDRYGVADGTIRAALEDLRAQGLIATQSTRGTFVLAEPGDAPSSEYEAVMARVDAIAEEVRQLREQVAELRRAQGA